MCVKFEGVSYTNPCTGIILTFNYSVVSWPKGCVVQYRQNDTSLIFSLLQRLKSVSDLRQQGFCNSGSHEKVFETVFFIKKTPWLLTFESISPSLYSTRLCYSPLSRLSVTPVSDFCNADLHSNQKANDVSALVFMPPHLIIYTPTNFLWWQCFSLELLFQ